MDEIWERAVETTLEGQTDDASVRTLNLDGAVKCVNGRLPPPSLLEKFENLQHLSVANLGISSLEQFPRLRNLQKLTLSDNRISGGLEFLVAAGLDSLRDLDLSNNRIQDINDLRPLAELRLVSLDLYECPVTRVRDYRSWVFGLIRSLKYLDNMDAEENERPDSDDDDDDDDEYDEVDEVEGDDGEDDPGSGEIDGEDHRPYSSVTNGHRELQNDGVVVVGEDAESDADENETKTSRGVSGSIQGARPSQTNGFLTEQLLDGEEDGDEVDGDNDSVEEVDDEEAQEEEVDDDDDDDDVVEVHEIEDSDDEEDGVEDDSDDDDDDDDDDEEEVDNDDGGFGELESAGRSTNTEGEIDGHEQGEDDADGNDDGETGEEELGIEEGFGDFDDEEDAEDEEDDDDTGYLVQPTGQVEVDVVASDMDPGNDLEDEDEDDEDGEVQEVSQPHSDHKRKRDEDSEEEEEEDSEDVKKFAKSSKGE